MQIGEGPLVRDNNPPPHKRGLVRSSIRSATDLALGGLLFYDCYAADSPHID